MSGITEIEIQDAALWEKKREQVYPLYSFDLELTARCNNNCRHCYINLPANDHAARVRELSLDEIAHIADQALEMGAVWVLLTGGEPLLRRDFADIYLLLKRKGLLVSLFTNATLIRQEHITLFRRFPPRDIEVTIYGASQRVYEAVSRQPGSYAAFMRGLEALLGAGIRVRLKAMALRSNIDEIESIAAFGRQYTKDFYRFDPALHLRYDRDEARNEEIRSERLTPEEIVALEQSDQTRRVALEKNCDRLIIEEFSHTSDNRLFTCSAGNGSFSVGYDGTFRLCSSLWAPGTTLNLREISLREAFENFTTHVRELRSSTPEFINGCRRCSIINLCLWCPAHAHLETGELDGFSDYFCQVAHARAAAIQNRIKASE